jgi:uncharacterized alpha-E superfamily protein
MGAGTVSKDERVVSPGNELFALLTDRTRPGTLAYAVHRLTGAAQAVREQLSPTPGSS